MYVQTPFQFLPPHIVRLIVDHIVGSSRMMADGVEPDSDEYRLLLRPLLWICRNFRAVACSLYCVRFTLTHSYNPGVEHGKALYTPEQVIVKSSNAYLGYPTLHLFKELDICSDPGIIYSGQALPQLLRPPYAGCSFPQVVKLSLYLELDEENEYHGICSPGDKANIRAFVQRVKEMAPIASTINVLFECSSANPRSNCPNFNDLVSQFFQLGTRVEYIQSGYNPVPVTLRLNGIRDLVHIMYSTMTGSEQFMNLARQNASTLRFLELEYEFQTDITELVQDADNNDVVYPHLHTLKLPEFIDINERARPVSKAAVPFPSLRHLRFRHGYPFGDDTPFRGNAASLESLDMLLHSSEVELLNNCNVFTPSSHPRLKYASIRVLSNPIFTTVKDLRLGLGIGVRAPVRRIFGHRPGGELVPALFSLGSYAYIQALILPDFCLELSDVLTIIKSLPVLSELHANFPTLGIIPPGISLGDLPAHVVSTHAPMGERFRCWNFGDHVLGLNEQAAKCVLILALVCTNFTYIVSGSDARECFRMELEDNIASDMFKDYVPHLRHLLSHRWKNR